MGIVSAPNGVPWRPPRIDRNRCWELVVLAAPAAASGSGSWSEPAPFTVVMDLADKET